MSKPSLFSLDFGKIAAEDEQDHLPNYFVEPQNYGRVKSGDAWLILGRKGSGKSAINVQLRAFPPSNTLVLDISPDEVGWAEIRTYSDCGIGASQAKKSMKIRNIYGGVE